MKSDVLLVQTPSYLHKLLNKTEDIILVCKLKDASEEKIYEVITPKKEKNQENMLDITGSPLKVDLDSSSILSLDIIENCNHFWQKNEENHFPISYENAKTFIQDYWYKNFDSLNPIPVWCVCDGSDKKRTLLMSAVQTPTYFTRCLVTQHGYLSKNDNSISFESLCKAHFDNVFQLTGKKQEVPLRQLTTEVSSIYELFGFKITQHDFNNINIQGSVYLEVNWNICRAEVPLDHSKSIMKIQTIVGQQKSVIYRFWKDLILLEVYIKTLAEYNTKHMLNYDWLPSNGDSSENLNLIDKIIEICSNSYHVPRYVPDSKQLFNIIQDVDSRHTYDITDRLWEVLNKCSTYGDLNDCLNVIFTEIAQSDNKVYIVDSNMTIMAQIIRDIVARKLPMFSLTGTQPIEILIDIGLEKLKKDFIHIYSEFGIINEQELNKIFMHLFHKLYLKEDFTSDAEITEENLEKKSRSKISALLYHKKSLINCEYFDELIKILGQLYTALETLILVPIQWQSTSIKTIVEHFVKNDKIFDSFATLAQKKLYEINIELPVSEISEYIQTLNPVMWRLSLTFSRPIYSVQSIFHLSQRPIFPPSIYNHDLLEGTVIDGNQVYYHYTQLSQVTNFIKSQLVK